MRLLFAPDTFKGSLTSQQINDLLSKAAMDVFKSVQIICVPVADGGEGTIDAIISAVNGEHIYVNTHDALNNPIKAYYAAIKSDM